MLSLLLSLATLSALKSCEDGNSQCGSWSDGGECTKNAAFMKDTCPLSCGICKPPPLLEQTDDPLLGPERVVLQIQWGGSSGSSGVNVPPQYGEIVLGFYREIAPVTVEHILTLVRMGGYNTNEIFRVDRGFVAQIQGVEGGRRAPMSKSLREVAKQTVPDEFTKRVSHTRGMLSMGKFDKPNTGTSSFSMVLGNAAFLDNKYTIFGRVVGGDAVLSKLEQVETKKEGIFVMPKERVEIVSAVVMVSDGNGGLRLEDCEAEKRKVEL